VAKKLFLSLVNVPQTSFKSSSRQNESINTVLGKAKESLQKNILLSKRVKHPDFILDLTTKKTRVAIHQCLGIILNLIF
jgi:hypothetical protein